MSKFWAHVANAFSSLFVGGFIMIQRGADGEMLTHGYLGLHLAMLAAFGLVAFNLFRAMQVCVYGEDF
jgi:hypothetical protein